METCTISIRSLLKRSSFTATAVITIALGISAKAAPAPDPLIPRSVIFADEDKLIVRLSPDGRTISYGSDLRRIGPCLKTAFYFSAFWGVAGSNSQLYLSTELIEKNPFG